MHWYVFCLPSIDSFSFHLTDAVFPLPEQLSESLHQLQAERDQYVEKLKEEGSIWQQRLQQLSEQVKTAVLYSLCAEALLLMILRTSRLIQQEEMRGKYLF